MTEKNKKQRRQGDVFILDISTEKIDLDKAEKLGDKNGLVVLAYGEATGHLHGLNANKAQLYRDKIGMILLVAEALKLKHGNPLKAWQGDHPDINIPAGKYRVSIDREYEPDGWRSVVD